MLVSRHGDFTRQQRRTKQVCSETRSASRQVRPRKCSCARGGDSYVVENKGYDAMDLFCSGLAPFVPLADCYSSCHVR